MCNITMFSFRIHKMFMDMASTNNSTYMYACMYVCQLCWKPQFEDLTYMVGWYLRIDNIKLSLTNINHTICWCTFMELLV